MPGTDLYFKSHELNKVIGSVYIKIYSSGRAQMNKISLDIHIVSKSRKHEAYFTLKC